MSATGWTLACDGCAADLTATVSFIAPQRRIHAAGDLQRTDARKLVFLIEARPPPDQAKQLKPGQPVR